jgi:hypothetical protein
MGLGGTNWIDMAENRDNCACECDNEPSGSIISGNFLD